MVILLVIIHVVVCLFLIGVVLLQQGKSADEAVAAKPTAQFDAKWATGFVTPDMFVKLVYQGV